MNSLLKDWGLRINTNKQQIRFKEDNKWKTKKIQIYKLDFDYNFNNFI